MSRAACNNIPETSLEMAFTVCTHVEGRGRVYGVTNWSFYYKENIVVVEKMCELIMKLVSKFALFISVS